MKTLPLLLLLCALLHIIFITITYRTVFFCMDVTIECFKGNIEDKNIVLHKWFELVPFREYRYIHYVNKIIHWYFETNSFKLWIVINSTVKRQFRYYIGGSYSFACSVFW